MLLAFIAYILPSLSRSKLLMAISLLYWYSLNIIFPERNVDYLIAETIFFCSWAFFVQFIPEISYLPYNPNNICIAFYKGKNNSLKARLSALLGLDVTSVDVLYKGSLWRYKHGKLIEMKDFKGLDNYIIYDTGIDKDISKTLLQISKIKYHKKWYNVNCTRILEPLLVELHLQPKGINQIPSLYLRSLLNARR
jgi:hypothetical protein